MDPYEYLTVFVSVILGLAVVHPLSGVSLILDTRIRERVDWIHAVWTANVFVTTLLVWWFNFSLTAIQEWTLLHFLNLVAYSVVLYLIGPPPIQWTDKCLSFSSVLHPRWSQKLPLRQRRRGVEGSRDPPRLEAPRQPEGPKGSRCLRVLHFEVDRRLVAQR